MTNVARDPDPWSNPVEDRVAGPRLPSWWPALALLLATAACASPEPLKLPVRAWSPETYVCQRTAGPLTIDGHLDEYSWLNAEWTGDFRDIEDEPRPTPRYHTRACMLWDDEHFYIGAFLEEPDVWATLTARDSVIFQDNDFEVFLDPDGDAHEYYELEINALGTEWDLFLPKPYRDGGPADHGWDMQGLRTAVAVQGTLNRPGDVDEGWTVEIAIPWAALDQDWREGAAPREGDQWWVNFSRVEWRVHVADGAYVKDTNPATGKPLPEDNWVWSPPGLINMHYPELWGLVEFSSTVAGKFSPPFQERTDAEARWLLWRVYYQERNHRVRHGEYTEDVVSLGLGRRLMNLELETSWGGFDASVLLDDGRRLSIDETGHLVVHQPEPTSD